MELYRLKSFLVIADTGNLTRAAQRMHISQSALSSQLRQLEEELDFSLFERTSRGMKLNLNGQEIIPLAKELLEAEDKLLKKARFLQKNIGKTLQIGLNADPGYLQVGAINRRLQLLCSEINVIFLASQSIRTATMLRKAQLDLAFLYGDIRDASICSQKLTDVRFCVVIPQTLKTEGKQLDWPHLAALPWIWVEQGSPPYDGMLEKFSRLRLQPQLRVKTVDEHIVKELVLEGQGVAIMREDEARPMVEKGQMTIWEKGWQTIPLNLAWTTDNNDNPDIMKARETISYLWQPSMAEGEENCSFDY